MPASTSSRMISSLSSSFSSSSSSSWETGDAGGKYDDNKGKRKQTQQRKRQKRTAATGHIGAELVRQENRVCAFCRRGHKEGLKFSKGFVDVLTEESVWATNEPFAVGVKNVQLFYAHAVCVHFCPQTSYDNVKKKWCDVTKEYQRSKALACVMCDKKGATIGCQVKNCNSSCHFPCGIQDNRRIWAPSQHLSESPFFCPNHQHERREHDREKEIERLVDLSRGREAIPIPLELFSASAPRGRGRGRGDRGVEGSDGRPSAEHRAFWERLRLTVPLPRGVLGSGISRLIDFTYVESIVDSESARVRRGPEREKRCCSCTGPNACRDPTKCECLRDGRNYRGKGRRLDEGHPPQVYECNLNCSCYAVDELANAPCRNRLVQRGISCQLVVAYLGPPSNRVSCMCGSWGVRAAAEIPAGSFVCSVAGQLILVSALDPLGEEDDMPPPPVATAGVTTRTASAAASAVPRSSGDPSGKMLLVHRVSDWISPRQADDGGSADSMVAQASLTSQLPLPQDEEEDEGEEEEEEEGGRVVVEEEKEERDGGRGASRNGKGKRRVARELLVDQRRYANISRYLRRARIEAHANLLRVAVHTANQDPRVPMLALFANQIIPKGTELLLGP